MEAKAITITERNRPMLAGRFMVDKDDWDDMLPLGYHLVTDFGNDEKFDTLTTDNFNKFFVANLPIENDFIAITPKDEAFHYPHARWE